MTERVYIYGHEVELSDTQDDEVVTDIIVLARSVTHDGEYMDDNIIIGSTKNTTGIIQTGMFQTAQRALENSQTGDDD